MKSQERNVGLDCVFFEASKRPAEIVNVPPSALRRQENRADIAKLVPRFYVVAETRAELAVLGVRLTQCVRMSKLFCLGSRSASGWNPERHAV